MDRPRGVLGPTVKLAQLWKQEGSLKVLSCGAGEDSWESLGLQGEPPIPYWRRLALGLLGKDWCWSWNSSTLATWCEELMKRRWCWERLKVGGEGDDRGWDGWMASPTQWTWVWVNSGIWWWTGRPSVLQSMGLQRVGHDWATELTDGSRKAVWEVFLGMQPRCPFLLHAECVRAAWPNVSSALLTPRGASV